MNKRTQALAAVAVAWGGALVGLVVGGCVPVAVPRLPQDVGAALARNPMHVLETEHLIVYYPEARQAEAQRLATHAEVCVGHLKSVAQIRNSISERKMAVFLAELPLNNAFVTPRLTGYDAEAVVSTHDTLDLFSLELGQPPDAAETACHELVHYVHLEQIGGFPWFMNTAFGATYTPQLGFDSWFDEGLAVYYETKLQPGTGRLAWPFWRGVFAAAYAGHRIGGGDLSLFQRDYHQGNHYLVGSQFVRFLADRYGEQRLWRLINVQGRAIFFPLWVNLRFWQVYDKTLSALIDEFADEVQQHLPPRARPAGQRVIRPVGYSARYARAADGTEALISADHDQPARLLIYAPDGTLRADRDLTDVLPPRRLADGNPSLSSGLGFTGDGRTLYFVAIDLDPTYQASRLYRYDVADDTLTVAAADLHGPGGSISPDGRTYVFARADGDRHDLAALDVSGGGVRVLHAAAPGHYLSNARFSPDGRRIVATETDQHHFLIRVFDAASGRPLQTLPTGDAPVHDPSWLDDRRIVYLGPAASSAGFQVYRHDLSTGQTDLISNAPYLAFEPRAAAAGTVRFLNRDGWQWTLDEVAPPAAPPPPPSPPPTAAETPPVPDTQAPPAAPVAPVAPIAAAPPAAPVATVTTSDVGPYRALDDLFTPRLHGLTLLGVGRGAGLFGLVLSGNDRLEHHRWTVAGYYQFAGGGEPSVQVGYANRQLAPLTLQLTASQFSFHDLPPVSAVPAGVDRTYTLYRRDRVAELSLSRLFYENPIALGFAYSETYRPGDPDAVLTLRRMAGPNLHATFIGAEVTPYTGPRRLFLADGMVAAYPRQWNTTGDTIVDVRGELDATIPLPLLRRHTLALGARGRDLVGASLPFLTLGGYLGSLIGRRSNQPEIKAVDLGIAPGFDFAEALRGFEDYPIAARRVVIGDATYRYPFIIDRGWASTLWVLPALFISQIDLELFGAAAREPVAGSPNHLAAGGALTLRTWLWVVPLNFQYQLARRLSDDRALTHLFTLAL